jgi:tetratricopeptide (TPR) repeat protein
MVMIMDEFSAALDQKDFQGAMLIVQRALDSSIPEARDQAPRRFLQVGEGLLAERQFSEAADAFHHACLAAPDVPIYHLNYGLAMSRSNQLPEAADALQKALALQPHYPLATIELMRVLELQGQFEEAVDVARRAMTERPTNLRRREAIKSLLSDGVDDSTIERWLDAACAQDRDEMQLRGRIAHVLLRAGEWTEAWPYYDDRRTLAPHTVPSMPLPEWRGRIASDHGVLLRCEQGLGDTIMFSRFASLLGAMGANVLLMVPRKLVKLLSNLPHVIEVLPVGKQVTADNFEWRLLMDLPAHFSVTPETIPVIHPKILAQPKRVARWRDLLPANGLNIGLAWQGSRENKSDRERSLPLESFAALADIPNVNLVALQVGDDVRQLENVPFGDQIIRPGPDFDAGPDGFLDTAGLMESLDLVVCCDSAVGHLAGTLGIPTFLALSAVPDWRWLGKGERTGWYPSMRLFRQREFGDWGPVVAAIKSEISSRAAVKQVGD